MWTIIRREVSTAASTKTDHTTLRECAETVIISKAAPKRPLGVNIRINRCTPRESASNATSLTTTESKIRTESPKI